MDTTYDICTAIRSSTLNRCAEATQYGSWSPEFAANYIRELPGLIRETKWFKPVDPNDLTKDQMINLGFKPWSDDNPLLLIPLWLMPYLAPTFEGGVISANEKVTLSLSEMDNDCRMGLLAYGVYVTE